MDAAAARMGRLEAAIVSPRFAARYAEATRRRRPWRRCHAARAAAGRAARRGAPHAPGPLTSATLPRHVVNMREGKLSGDGQLQLVAGAGEGIFKEWIPA